VTATPTPSGPTGQPFPEPRGHQEEWLARWAGTCHGRSFPARWAGLGERLAPWAARPLLPLRPRHNRPQRGPRDSPGLERSDHPRSKTNADEAFPPLGRRRSRRLRLRPERRLTDNPRFPHRTTRPGDVSPAPSSGPTSRADPIRLVRIGEAGRRLRRSVEQRARPHPACLDR